MSSADAAEPAVTPTGKRPRRKRPAPAAEGDAAEAGEEGGIAAAAAGAVGAVVEALTAPLRKRKKKPEDEAAPDAEAATTADGVPVVAAPKKKRKRRDPIEELRKRRARERRKLLLAAGEDPDAKPRKKKRKKKRLDEAVRPSPPLQETDPMKHYLAGEMVPCPVGCGAFSEVVRISTREDGSGEVWFECLSCAQRREFAVPASTAADVAQIRAQLDAGQEAHCLRHGDRVVQLRRRGQAFVCPECGVAYQAV